MLTFSKSEVYGMLTFSKSEIYGMLSFFKSANIPHCGMLTFSKYLIFHTFRLKLTRNICLLYPHLIKFPLYSTEKLENAQYLKFVSQDFFW